MTVYVLSTDNSGMYRIDHTDDWSKTLAAFRDNAHRIVVHFLDHDAGVEACRVLQERFQVKLVEHDSGLRVWFRLSQDDFIILQDLLTDSRKDPETWLEGLD